MRVKIWGAQGSLPSPITSDAVSEKIVDAILKMPEIDTGDVEAVQAYVNGLPALSRGTAKGNTSCVEVQAGGETIIIDAGTGIRELGLELMKGSCGRGEGKLHQLFSHPHWDHIQGFPFFIPAFIPGNHITFYGFHDLQQALTDQQQYLMFPVAFNQEQAHRELAMLAPDLRQRYDFIPAMLADYEFVSLSVGQPFSIGTVHIETSRNRHPGDAYSYRIEDQHSRFVYGGDAEYRELNATTLEERVAFWRDADAVLFDAQYGLRDSWETKENYGHSSAMIGVDFARRAGAKRLLLTHHEPTHSDQQLQEIQDTAIAYQLQDSTLPTCEVIVAYQGLELDLSPSNSIGFQHTHDHRTRILTPDNSFEESVGQLMAQLMRSDASESLSGSVVDLSSVERLTTASLKKLILFSQEYGSGAVVLAAPSPQVQEVIRLSGYRDHFAIYESVSDAVQAVQAREALGLEGYRIDGRYQILEVTHTTAATTILRAHDLEREHDVRLTVLSPSFEGETIQRFTGVAGKLVGLEHPHVNPIYSCATTEAGAYTILAESYRDEPTLGQQLIDGQAPHATVDFLAVALDLVDAMVYVHSYGVVHGNLKPDDIYMTDQGAIVTGFGYGQLESGRDLQRAPHLFLSALTLAPEQISGQPPDTRADLYALGVILYWLSTGQAPFDGADDVLLRAHLTKDPTPPRKLNPQLSTSLDHLICKLLAKNPNDRYGSARQVQRILTTMIAGEGIVDSIHESQLVGRERESKILLAGWTQVLGGKGHVAFVTGEAGVGKSSLIRRVISDCHGGVLLSGGCRDGNSTPYGPIVDALQSYFSSVPPEILEPEMWPWLADFALLVPNIRKIVPNLPVRHHLEAEQEQLRIMSGLTQYILHATSIRPWILVLDDLQWVDEASIELLRFLCRRLPDASLYVIGLYRDTDVDLNHPIFLLRRELMRNQPILDVPLGRLTPAEVAAKLADIWDDGVPAPFVGRLYEQTQGNPLYVEAAARGLEDDGRVTYTDGRWHYTALEEIRLPESIYEAVERRIHYLSADTRDVLAKAAVLGVSFRLGVLEAMNNLSTWSLLEHIDIALERQIVRETDEPDEFEFDHVAIHHAIYDDIGPLRRRRLHYQAGIVLEERYADDLANLADDLSIHFSAAHEWQKAIGYGLQVARRAKEMSANEMAAARYQELLAMIDDLDPSERENVKELSISVLQDLGDVLAILGRWQEAEVASSRALRLAQDMDDDSAVGRAQLSLGYQKMLVGRLNDAEQWFEAAYYSFERNGDRAGIGAVYHHQGTLASRQGRTDVAERLYSTSLEIRRELDDQFNQANLLNNLGIIAARRENWALARSRYLECLDIRDHLGDKRGSGITLTNLGNLAVIGGLDDDEAVNRLQQASQLLEEVGDRRALTLNEHTLANVYREQGEFEASSNCYRCSLVLYEELDLNSDIPEWLADTALLRANLNAHEEALYFLYAAESLAAQRDIHFHPRLVVRLGEVRGQSEAWIGSEAADAIEETAKMASMDEAIAVARESL